VTLPVEAVLPELLAALRSRGAAVLVAPPGAGKTTLVPLALRDLAAGGKIILLSPRRIAARAAAARMATLLGEKVGETVGYRVRLESRVSARTWIEVVTEGVFTRQILADPSLEGVAAVIFDEFHERSLEGDLGLALALDARAGLRDDLRLLVMSATLEAGRVAKLLGDAPVVVSEGRLFPITDRYLGRDPRARLEDQMAAAVQRAVQVESGSILCFLPGAREIERTAQLLMDARLPSEVAVHTLYGARDAKDQDEAIALAPAGTRKVVLATSIAETSLTIEGVRVVIDSGFTRRPVYEPGVGLTRLETVRVSQAAATQRRGRAGRLEPGACWRLWDEPETRAFAPFDRPEILEADLSSFVLDLALWGARDASALCFLDPPPAAALAEARTMLKSIGALEPDGVISAHGKRLSGFGLSPRLAHMVLRAAEVGDGRLAGRVAALLTEQGLGGREVDLRGRLSRAAADQGARAKGAFRLAESWAKAAGAEPTERVDSDRAGHVLALGFPDRIAKARPGRPGEFVMANGRGVGVKADDPLAQAPFLAVAEASGRAERAVVQAAAPLSAVEVERLFADRIETLEEVGVDPNTDSLRARRVRRLGAIVLSEGPLQRPSREAVTAALLEAVHTRGLGALTWSETDRQTRARIAFLRKLEGEPWPDVSDEALLARLDIWLAPLLDGVMSLGDTQGQLGRALMDELDYQLRRRLDEQAPARFESPAEGSHLIDYEIENGPAVSLRLQELFGETRHPSIAEGRVPLLLLLLSPAGRPVQTTRDLPGFWTGSYAGVRADLRGRYPKHPWPEDPRAAPPTRRVKPRPT
jgi:ATP-dependent helicase HrpB